MFNDTNGRQSTYLEYVASEQVASAFEKSFHFKAAKYMCVGAAFMGAIAIAFAFGGSVVMFSQTVDMRGQLTQQARQAESDIKTIVSTAKLESEKILTDNQKLLTDGQKTLTDNQNLLSTEYEKISGSRATLATEIEKGVKDIKVATIEFSSTFKKAEDELRKEIIGTLVKRLEAQLNDSRSDLMAEVNKAKERVTIASKQAIELEETAADLKPKLRQIGQVVLQGQGLDRQIASIEEKERSARASEAAIRDSRSAAEVNQKSAAAAEALTFASLGSLPGKVAKFSEDLAKIENGIEVLKDQIGKDQTLLQQRQELGSLGERIGNISKDMISIRENLEKLRLATEALKTEKVPPPPPLPGSTWPNCDVQPSESCKRLQEALNRKLGSRLIVDGRVGELTQSAIKVFKEKIQSADVTTNPYTLSDLDKQKLFSL